MAPWGKEEYPLADFYDATSSLLREGKGKRQTWGPVSLFQRILNAALKHWEEKKGSPSKALPQEGNPPSAGFHQTAL